MSQRHQKYSTSCLSVKQLSYHWQNAHLLVICYFQTAIVQWQNV